MIEEIKELIEENIGVEGIEITEDTSFVDDIEVDSLELLSLALAIEKKYEIKIPREEFMKLTSVGLLINYLNTHKNDSEKK